VDAEAKEMRERVDVRRRDVRIVREIIRGVEIDRRIAALVPSGLVEVIERVDAGRFYVGVGREISVGIVSVVRDFETGGILI